VEQQPIDPLPPSDTRPLNGRHLLLERVGHRVASARHDLVRSPAVSPLDVVDHCVDPVCNARVPAVDLLFKVRVALEQLAGGEAQRDAGLYPLVLENPDHRVNRVLDLSVETQRSGILPSVHGLQRLAEQLLEALPPPTDGLYHRDPEPTLESFDVDLHSPALGLVHHVERHHQRASQFQQLQRQLQGSTEPAGIDDVDDEVVVLIQQVALRLASSRLRRGERVDPGEIHDLDLSAVDQCPTHHVRSRRTGKVRRCRSVSCYRIEDGALAGVWLPREHKPHVGVIPDSG
jgi:hypothetical protein